MKVLCLTAALSSFGISLVIVIDIRATPPSIQKLITQPSPREYSHGPTPIPSFRPFLIFNNLFGSTPFWCAEGQTPHEYNWGVAQSILNLKSELCMISPSVSMRLLSLCMILISGGREACMDWMTLGWMNNEAHGQKLMPYPLSRGPVR